MTGGGEKREWPGGRATAWCVLYKTLTLQIAACILQGACRGLESSVTASISFDKSPLGVPSLPLGASR